MVTHFSHDVDHLLFSFEKLLFAVLYLEIFGFHFLGDEVGIMQAGKLKLVLPLLFFYFVVLEQKACTVPRFSLLLNVGALFLLDFFLELKHLSQLVPLNLSGLHKFLTPCLHDHGIPHLLGLHDPNFNLLLPAQVLLYLYLVLPQYFLILNLFLDHNQQPLLFLCFNLFFKCYLKNVLFLDVSLSFVLLYLCRLNLRVFVYFAPFIGADLADHFFNITASLLLRHDDLRQAV